MRGVRSKIGCGGKESVWLMRDAGKRAMLFGTTERADVKVLGLGVIRRASFSSEVEIDTDFSRVAAVS